MRRSHLALAGALCGLYATIGFAIADEVFWANYTAVVTAINVVFYRLERRRERKLKP